MRSIRPFRDSWTWPLVPFAVFAAMAQLHRAQAQCSALMQNMSTAAYTNKCGFMECLPSTPPQFFLLSTTVETAAYTGSQTGGGGYSHSWDNEYSVTTVATMAR